MGFINLKREEMQLLEQGARYITIKRDAANHGLPQGVSEQIYWAREYIGDKNRFRLSPVSALCLNDNWNVVMQRIF